MKTAIVLLLLAGSAAAQTSAQAPAQVAGPPLPRVPAHMVCRDGHRGCTVTRTVYFKYKANADVSFGRGLLRVQDNREDIPGARLSDERRFGREITRAPRGQTGEKVTLATGPRHATDDPAIEWVNRDEGRIADELPQGRPGFAAMAQDDDAAFDQFDLQRREIDEEQRYRRQLREYEKSVKKADKLKNRARVAANSVRARNSAVSYYAAQERASLDAISNMQRAATPR